MRIVIAGASGLIGIALTASLEGDGHEITRLVRRPATTSSEAEWSPSMGELDPAIIEGVDAVINLAGAGIGDRRWTDDYKDLLISSRVSTTALLANTSAAAAKPPRVFIGGSAIGYYGNRGDEILTESSSKGDGFLADLVEQWERAAQPAADAGIRTVAIRTGLVMTPIGGVLPKFLPLFRLGLGGRFGSGQQYLSWISLDDALSAITATLADDSVSGPVNLTAPAPVTSSEFATTLGQVLGRPVMLPVPRFGPRLLLGRERADALLFEGQRVLPDQLGETEFEFRHPTLEQALSDLLANR